MSEQKANSRQRFLGAYQLLSAFMREPLATLMGASEVDALESDAAREFEALLDDIPYADRPGHVMALPSLASASRALVGDAVEQQRRYVRVLFELRLPTMSGEKHVAVHRGSVVGFAHWVPHPPMDATPT